MSTISLQSTRSRSFTRLIVAALSAALTFFGAVSPASAAAVDLTSAGYDIDATHNAVTITLTGGTYKAGSILASDFTFADADLSSGTFTRTSSTVVTVTGLAGVVATGATVTVKAATQATEASAVTVVPDTLAITSPSATLLSAHNEATITLAAGKFKAAPIAASDFTFAGASAAALALGTFTRTSDQVVTISGISGLSGSNNTVTVKAASMEEGGSTVALAATKVAVTSDVYTLTSGDNSVVITLSGGTFKNAAIGYSDFIFDGDSNAQFDPSAGAIYTRTSSTVVTVTGLTSLSGNNNLVTVKAATMVNGAASVSVAGDVTSVTSPVFTLAAADNAVTVTLTGGSFKPAPLAASDFTFGGASAAILATGSFERTSDTVVTITGLSGMSGTNNTVTVKSATLATGASSVAGDGITVDVTSPAFTLSAGQSMVTITLTGGTFKAGTIAYGDFTFAGTSAAEFVGATYTRTSNTVVTITGLSSLNGADNTVTVKAATMNAGAASVAAEGSVSPVTSANFSLSATQNTVTLTLTGGTYKAGPIAASDFTFTGASASILATGTFTRTSDTVVTITGLSGMSGTNNAVAVKGATLATAASAVAGAGSLEDVTSAEYTLSAANNTVVITLTGGTFKAGTIAYADFTFGGTSAARFTAVNGAIYTRTSSTVVTITGLSSLDGADNTVTVKAATMVNGAASVAASGSATAVTSATYTLTSAQNVVTITLADGTFKAGTIAASDFTFAGTSAAALALGTFTRTSDTVVTITGVSGLGGTDNTVTVKAATLDAASTSVSAAGSLAAVTSAEYTLTGTQNTVTITLTGGTFKAGPIAFADFTFGGTSAARFTAINGAVYTRTSSTVVTITGLSSLSGTDNTVTVKTGTMVNAAASVAAVGATASITSPTYELDSTENTVTVTLTGGTFKAGAITASDFTFAGASAARFAAGTFTRTSDTVVTITGISGLSGSNNTITVKGATMDTPATSVAAVGSLTTVTSAVYTLTASQNTVTITLTGGTFKEGVIAYADFTFAGASAARFTSAAGAIYTRTSDTVVTITGLTSLSGANNTVTVKTATMATGAASVEAVGSIGAVTSAAYTLTSAHNTVTITLTGGTFKAAPIVAADFTFTGTSAAALALGTFTRTSDTVVTITGLSGLSGTNNTVTVNAGTLATGATSVAAVGSLQAITSSAVTFVTGLNTLTITLTGGTFKTGAIGATDFIFAGTSATALASATFTRISDTVVVMTGFSALSGTNNTVTVKAGTMVRGASSVAAVASSEAIITPAYALTSADNAVTITLTGGTFKAGTIEAADFTFAGTSATLLAAGTFTRTSDTVVTITGVSGLSGTNNLITVKLATMASAAATVAAVGTTVAVTSPAFTLTATQNTVTLTLTGGTFKTGTLVASDFTFTGTSAAALALGTFTRLSNTVVTIGGLAGLSGTNNTVTVKAATMANGATSVAAAGSVGSITSTLTTLTAAHNTVTITLNGGAFKTGTITADDFTFGGTSATALAGGTFTRTSDTVVTVTGLSGLSGTDNLVLVKPASMTTGASAVALVGSTSAVTSTAVTLTALQNTVTITLTGGTFRAGVIASTDFTFAGTSATALSAGIFTRTSDSVVTITGVTGLSGTNNTVTVKTTTMANGASAVVAAASTEVVTSNVFTLTAAQNAVTITIVGGTFKAGAIAATDFTFAGTSAAALAAGTFTRTSDTVVTITGVSGLSGTNNTVAIKPATMATAVTGIGATASTASVTSPVFSMTPALNAITITLTGGTFKAGAIAATDFSFTGIIAADLAKGVFTRTSDTVVTVTGLGGFISSTNTATVLAATMATGAASVRVVGLTIAPPAGPTAGIMKATTAAARTALKPTVTKSLTSAAATAPSISVKLGTTVALRVTGLTIYTPYTVRVFVGTTSVGLGSILPSSKTATLPAFKAAKKGTYFIQLTDPIGKQRFVRVVVK